MELLQIGNYKYHYQKAKNESKGIIVFIHGFATNSFYHKPFANLLTDYDYYAYEHPGHGISELQNEDDLHPYQLALHVIEWIKLMKFEKINLIGHSMGGGIVGMVASMIPTYIENLIMVTPMNSSFSLKLLNVFKFNPKNDNETFEMQKMLYKDATKHFSGPDDKNIINETKYQLKNRSNFKKLLFKMSSLDNHIKLKKSESNINNRTLLILGKHDGIIDWKSAQKHFSINPNFTISVFDDSGHLPFIEETDKYYKTIIDFIENR